MDDIIERTDDIEQEASNRLLNIDKQIAVELIAVALWVCRWAVRHIKEIQGK